MNQLTVHTNSPHTYAVCRFPDSIWMHRRYYNRDEISTTPSFFPAAFPVRTYLPKKVCSWTNEAKDTDEQFAIHG